MKNSTCICKSWNFACESENKNNVQYLLHAVLENHTDAITLTLFTVGSGAEFTKKLYNEKAPLGGEMTFSVQTHGKPLPEVSW